MKRKLLLWLLMRLAGEPKHDLMPIPEKEVIYRELHRLANFYTLMDLHIDWAKTKMIAENDEHRIDFYRGYIYHCASMKEWASSMNQLWIEKQDKLKLEKEKQYA